MTKKFAQDIFQLYIDGWKKKDISLIASNLSPRCVVIEHSGPIHNGLKEIKEWAENWFESGNSIDHWNISSCILSDVTAFFEWEYAYVTKDKGEKFEGASVVYFEEDKIVSIREYRMTAGTFNSTAG